jgi:hypothetical protein
MAMIAHVQAAKYLLISDPAATIIAALIGALAGIAGTFLAYVLPERKKRAGLIADLLDGIAKTVTRMIDMFGKLEIPHEAGHELFTTIVYFKDATPQKLLSPMALETLDKLKRLSQEAVVVDVVLFTGESALREAWVTKAKGIVGELRGEAAKLRARF